MADFTNIANLRGPKGDDGDPGLDGSNVLPTDEAMAQTAADPESAFATQLSTAQPSRIVARKVETGIREFAPLATQVRRDSPQTIESGAEVAFIANTRDWSTDGAHSLAEPSRITWRERWTGLVVLNGAVRWAGNNVNTRTIEFRKNGVVIKSDTVPGQAATFTQTMLPFSVFADPGDYFEMFVRQSSGVALAIQPTSTFFSLISQGELAGMPGGSGFKSSFGARGTKYYDHGGGSTINSRRIEMVADPAGIDRTVARIHTRNTDNQVQYPRVQGATPSLLVPGATYWSTWSMMVPSEQVLNENQVMIHEIYGPPAGKGSPVWFRINNQGFLYFDDTKDASGELDFTNPAWTAPLVRDRWYRFKQRTTLSKDPAVGSVELYMQDGDQAPYVQQRIRGDLRHMQATLAVDASDSNRYDTIKVAYGTMTGYPDGVVVYFDDHRVDTSEAKVA